MDTVNDIYEIINLENGDILLKKIIIDNTLYFIINKENGDILLKKIHSININNIRNLKKYNFSKSTICECIINDVDFNKLKYKLVLDKIYSIIDDGVTIIRNTKLNIKTIKKEDEGFYYLDDIGISVQGVDSNKCLLEIVNQSIINEIKLYMKIKLIDGVVIKLIF